jgi:hypothetical protein
VAVPVSGLASGVSAIAATGTDPSGRDAVTNCALTEGGVWCWGGNGAGQLGNNSTTDSAVPVAVAGLGSGVSTISSGPCALKGDGLWCWGMILARAVGKSWTESHVPVAVPGLASGVDAIRGGCAIKDGGVSCEAGPVPGLESGVSAIGGECAVKDGGVWCWGTQLADNSPGQATPATGRLPSNAALPVSGLERGVSAINDGWPPSACAIKDGGVWCWGGIGSDGNVVTSPVARAVPGLASGVSAIEGQCVLKDDSVLCLDWTGDDPGDPNTTLVTVAVPGLESGVTAISGMCALKEFGVWCWGRNLVGQLGNDSPPYSPLPVAVVFP